MRRLAVFVGVALAGLLAVGMALAWSDLGRFKDQIVPLVSEAAGRELRVDGLLSIRLGRSVRIEARQVVVADEPWAGDAAFLKVEALVAEVALRSLLRGPVQIERLELGGATLRLVKNDEGLRNWSWLARAQDTDHAGAAAGRSAAGLPVVAIRDARISISAPALTSRSEIDVAAMDVAAVDGALVATADASVNGRPFQVTVRAGQAPAPAGPLRLDIDARLGEIALRGHADVADVGALAISSADVELTGPDAKYLFDVFKLPPLTSGRMHLRASLSPDPQRSAFTANLGLGDYRLGADGWFEDAGRFDINWDTAGPNLAALGRQLAVEGLPDKPYEAAGTLRSRVAGIDIDNARFRIGDMALEATGSLVRQDGGGHLVSLSAQRSDARLDLAVGTRQGLSLRGATVAFGLSGPSAAATARSVGVRDLPPLPFDLQGKAVYESGSLRLDSSRITLGGQRVDLSGRVGSGATAYAADLHIDADALDLTQLVAVPERLQPLARSISASGRLQAAAGSLRVSELTLRPAGATGPATIDAAVTTPKGADNVEFDLHIALPGLESVQSSWQSLPFSDEPLDANFEGRWQPRRLELRSATLRLGERGALDADMVLAAGDRPSLAVNLRAQHIDLRTESVAPAPAPRTDERMIPDIALPLEWLDAVDASVTVDIGALYARNWAGGSLKASGDLHRGQLRLHGIETRGRRGQIDASLVGEPQDGTYLFDLRLDGRELRVAPPEEGDETLAARPSYTLSAALNASGTDVRTLAETLNGRLTVTAGAGTVRRRAGVLATLVLEDLLTRTLESVNPLSADRDELSLSCLVLKLDFHNGLASGDPLLALQTRELNLVAKGSVELGTEALDIDISAQPRRGLGISIGDLINPFTRIGGTLGSPRIVADPGSALVQTGAGIATGGLWPLARKLHERFLAGDPCKKALEVDQP